MTELPFHYSVRSRLPARAESPASLGAKFVGTLDALSRIDPLVFNNWEVIDLPKGASLPLAAARACIGAIVNNNVARDDWKEPEPQSGYSAVAFTSTAIRSRELYLTIKTGGNIRGETWLQAGQYRIFPDPTVVTYPLFRAAMLDINAIWPPSWACADAFRMDYDKAPLFPSASLFPYSCFHIPWFAYLSAPFAAGLKLSPEIQAERTPDGGLLMSATTDRLDPTNPEHLRHARILAETMIERTGYQPGGTTRS